MNIPLHWIYEEFVSAIEYIESHVNYDFTVIFYVFGSPVEDVRKWDRQSTWLSVVEVLLSVDLWV